MYTSQTKIDSKKNHKKNSFKIFHLKNILMKIVDVTEFKVVISSPRKQIYLLDIAHENQENLLDLFVCNSNT